ncbi:MAG TPA: hypothetical protein P5260_06500 [Candidatus Competibacter sp.]|nr:hypothetical protein [Candidatus Competibacter sp.]
MILSAPLPAGEPLEQRVQRYWAARAANDLQTVYGLESASLPGGWLTPDQYKLLGGLPVREVKILETKIEGDKAIVKIQGQVAVGALGWTLQTLDDKWALINDEWYHQTRKSE